MRVRITTKWENGRLFKRHSNLKVVALVRGTARSSEAFLFSKDACRLGVANVFATTLRFLVGATPFSQRHSAVGVGLDAEPTNVSLCGQAAHVIHSVPTQSL